MCRCQRSIVLTIALVPALCVGTLCLTLRVVNAADDLGFKVPPGFEVSLFADDDLAHDIFSMTIDAKGRVVVAGRGYVKILHDDNADGRADRATLFSNKPASGAHGMYFDGPDLICTGDDALMRLRDTNDDGVADGSPEIWSRLRHPEHGANGVVKGPDGWFYVACGNDAEVTEKHATTPHSPVKKPNCGAIVRFSPDGKQSEIFAHGFRNPYDLDFNEHGHLFTVDADGERDQYLPWYAPTRLFDVAQGMHHGWVLRGWTRSWNRPEYFPDNVERLVEIGRGSPTGLVCYRHRAFPTKYRGGIFSACWTLGTIYYFPLTPKGSTYTSHKDIFMQTTGQTGFAPVDLAVGPAGDLFVAIGGRGTRGGVFRVAYKNLVPKPESPDDPMLLVIDADQPLSSWSRARWARLASLFGLRSFERAIGDGKYTPAQWMRALDAVAEVFPGTLPTIEGKVFLDLDAAVQARVLWATAQAFRNPNTLRHAQRGDGIDRIVRKIESKSLAVQRAAWDALASVRWVGIRDVNDLSDGQDRWSHGLGNADRRVRAAALATALDSGRESRHLAPLLKDAEAITADLSGRERDVAATQAHFAAITTLMTRDARKPIWRATFTSFCVDLLTSVREPKLQLEAIRIVQRGCGDLRLVETRPDLYTGYAFEDVERLSATERGKLLVALLHALTSNDTAVVQEAARTLGALGVQDDRLPLQIALCLKPDSDPGQAIHTLIVLSRVGGTRSPSVTTLTTSALTELHIKMNAAGYQTSRNWPDVVGEVFDELCKRDPALADAVASHRDFGLPEHTLFAERMPRELRKKAARKIFDAAIKAEDTAGWSPEMVALVGGLWDADVRPKLRELWDDEPGLRDAIAMVLVRSPADQDRSRLVTALVSPESNVIVAAAKSLRSLEKPGKPDEIADALRMLREYCVPGKHAEVRQELTALLTHWTDQKIPIDERNIKDLRAAYQPWFDWFAKTHPVEAAKMTALGEVDAAAWAKRLNAIDFSAGDAARGRKVFDARACNRCHGGNSRLGPDLVGVTRRFSRADLFTSIIDPNKDVSPLYQTTQLTTKTGQTHVGILIYESPESSLLQTGPDTTIRITDEDVSKRRPSRQSLMPTNLLNAATDRDFADLWAYMKSTDGK